MNFAAMPLTEADAKSKGFQKISDCGGMLSKIASPIDSQMRLDKLVFQQIF